MRSSDWSSDVCSSDLARADAPEGVLTPTLVVAGTDSRSMEPVSEDVYRFMPMHFTLKEAGMIHGTNQHMAIDSFKRLIDFYARLLRTSTGCEPEERAVGNECVSTGVSWGYK